MKTRNVLIVALTILAMTSCKEKKAPTMEHQYADETTSVNDTTIYGKLGENYGMNTLELITDKGDTLQFIVEEPADSLEMETVKGGKGIGDRMALVAQKNEEGELIVTQAVNLTTLLGKWVALDKSFEIQEGGVVVSNFSEPKPYTEWSICNGHLVLSADTFDVFELGADSLKLENAKGIYVYKRQK
ncbi:MAG: lipocalin family protein [Prevotella sp.]|nr:lipocalin family protein [Prevotella sp.]